MALIASPTNMINDSCFFIVLWGNCINYAGVERSFQGVLTVAAKSLQPYRIVHGLEQQPEGVQVVERVGLVGNFSVLPSEHIP